MEEKEMTPMEALEKAKTLTIRFNKKTSFQGGDELEISVSNKYYEIIKKALEENEELKKQLNALDVRNASENPENKQNNEHKTEKDVRNDILVDFDEYGFTPTTLCDWEIVTERMRNDIKELIRENEKLKEQMQSMVSIEKVKALFPMIKEHNICGEEYEMIVIRKDELFEKLDKLKGGDSDD